MSDPGNISLGAHLERVHALLAERLGLKGRDLAEMERRARRLLPRARRRDLAFLARVQAHCANPARAHEYDPARVVAATERLERFLKRQDPARRRARLRLSILHGMAMNLILLALAAGAALLWLR